MRKVSPRQYAHAFIEAYDSTPENERDAVVNNFLKLIKKNRNWKKISQILGAIRMISNERAKKVDVRFISAKPVIGDGLHKLEQGITAALKQQAVIHQETNPSVIGGAKVVVGDTLIDGTVKHALEKLQSTF